RAGHRRGQRHREGGGPGAGGRRRARRGRRHQRGRRRGRSRPGAPGGRGPPGGDSLPVLMDTTSRASAGAGVEAVLRAWGRIDLLANVAGWDRIVPFVATTGEVWGRVIRVN